MKTENHNSKGNTVNNAQLMDEEIDIRQIIDVGFLQKFLDAFSEAVGVAGLATDKDGNPLTKPSNFTEFCMKVNRGCEKGLKRCMKSDAYGGAESAKTGRPAVYYCENGLMDFGAPIILNGKQVGSILGGQVLTREPKREKYEKLAEEIGVDKEVYLKALSKVKIVPEKQIRAAAELLFIVSEEISRMGYEKLRLSRMANILNDSVQKALAILQQLAASATNVTENQNRLSEEIQAVENISEKIDGVTESVKNIADQSHLLGLNATIEAARAKEYGLGFGIVANEIQKLSTGSKETVAQIKQLTSQIKGSVKKTKEMANATLSAVEEQQNAIMNILQALESVTGLAKELADFSK